MKPIIPIEPIERRIYLIRGHKVMVDSDLAGIYGVTTKRLNEQVRRNQRRFPADFMFQLLPQEAAALRSHFATLKSGTGRHRKYLPYVFTEYGAVMLSSILSTPVAVQASVQIARAFVKMRGILSAHKSLAKRLESIENRLIGQDAQLGTHAREIQKIFAIIHQLMDLPEKPRPRIGFMP